MPEWFDKQVSETGEWGDQKRFMRQTRRQVLGGIAGVVSMSLFGTRATGASEQVKQSEFEQVSSRNGPDRQFSRTPASGGCAPTSFEREWISKDLGPGVTNLTFRRDSDGPVYVSGRERSVINTSGQIYALNRENGEALDGWPISVPGVPSVQPLKDDQTVYIALDTTLGSLTVASVEPTSGQEQWRREFSGQFGYGFGYDRDSDAIYLVLSGPEVIGLNATTGETRWSAEVGTGARITGSIREGSTLYAIGADGNGNGLLSAIDTESEGTEKWRVTRSVAAASVPSFGSDFVVMSFAAQQQGNGGETDLLAIEKDSGGERWSTGRDDNLFYSGRALVDGDAIYAPAGRNQDQSSPDSQGVVERLDAADGGSEYEVDVGGKVLGLRKDDQRVYTQTRPGDVIGIDDDPSSSEYGSEAWRRSLQGDIVDGGFSLVCDVLYTGTDDNPGQAYAIDSEDGEILGSHSLEAGAVKTGFALDGDVWTVSGNPIDADTDSDVPRQAYRFTGSRESLVTVSLSPEVVEVAPDGETTVDIVIGGADTGVGSYEMSLGFGEQGVASISNVSLARGPASGVDVADDGSSATLDVGLNDPFESVQNTVATVTLAGETQDATTLGFDGVTIVGSRGTEQTVEARQTASVLVTDGDEPLPILEDPPTDPDGDELYEDLDGDGEFSLGDVSLFLEQFRSPVVQRDAEFFNFDDSDPDEVTLDDVRELFSDYADQSSGGAADLGIEVKELSEEQLAAILDGY